MDYNNQNWNNNGQQNNTGQQYNGQQYEQQYNGFNGQQQFNGQQYGQQYGQQNQSYINIDYNGQAMNDGTKTAAAVGALGLISMLPNILLIMSLVSLFCCGPLSLITLILSIIYSCILGKNNKVGTARMISIIALIFMIISLIVAFTTGIFNKDKSNNEGDYDYNNNYEYVVDNDIKENVDTDYTSTVKDGHELIIDGLVLKLNDAYGNNIEDLPFNTAYDYEDWYPEKISADDYEYIQYYYSDNENIEITYVILNNSEYECDIKQCKIVGIEIDSTYDNDLLNNEMSFDLGYGISSDRTLNEMISTLMNLDSDYYTNENDDGSISYIFSVLDSNTITDIHMLIVNDALINVELNMYTNEY